MWWLLCNTFAGTFSRRIKGLSPALFMHCIVLSTLSLDAVHCLMATSETSGTCKPSKILGWGGGGGEGGYLTHDGLAFHLGGAVKTQAECQHP